MKIATWNVNSLAVRLPQLLDWLAAHQPDVLCLQETKLADDKFPHAAITEAGYQVHWFGQKTYNGVALISKSVATDVVRNIPGHDDHQARVIAATVDGIRIIGAYVPNGQSVESEKFPYKLAWLEALRDWVKSECAVHPQLALLGDYNIAPEDRDVHDPVTWAGRCCARPRSGRTSRLCSGSACTMLSACSSRRQSNTAGGTTGCWRSARTRACASTTSSSAMR